MAKEITALSSVKERDGTVRWELFLQFPISPAITNAQGQTVAPLTSAAIGAGTLAFFTSAEQTTLTTEVDSGARGYLYRTIDQSPGETDAAFSTRLKAYWSAVRTHAIQLWRDQYAKTGTQITAP